jgi:hypothetical protein
MVGILCRSKCASNFEIVGFDPDPFRLSGSATLHREHQAGTAFRACLERENSQPDTLWHTTTLCLIHKVQYSEWW